MIIIRLLKEQSTAALQKETKCSDPQVLLCIYCSVMLMCERLLEACQSNTSLPSSKKKVTRNLTGLQLLISVAES